MLVGAEVWSVVKTDKGSAVLVKPRDLDAAVPIYIGTAEAQSILIGMLDEPLSRPLTHDLFLGTLRILGVELLQVDIHTLSEGVFYASLILKTPEGKKEMDSRPSDALALAVRKKCPVFIAEDLVDEVAIPLDLIRDVEGEENPAAQGTENSEDPPWADEDLIPRAPQVDRRRALQETLDRLVEEENYEEAARIRDELKKLDS